MSCLRRAVTAATIAVILAASAATSTATPRVNQQPIATATQHVADWTGTATEAYEPYGSQSQWPDYKVTIQSTSCTDVATSVSLSSCQVSATLYFYIDIQTINGHKVKLCEPENDDSGDNAYAHYTPSSGHAETNPNGNGYMSPAYTEDQPLPAKAPAHFHFEASIQPDSNVYTTVIEGHGAGGLRACANSTDKNIKGSVLLVANN